MAVSGFSVRARGSTLGRELRGGLVTFVTMSYIVVLNPLILGSFDAAGLGAKRDVLGAVLPVAQVAAVTALVAGVMTLLFGAIANYPFAIATGLGINTLVAVSIAPQVSWPEAMGLVHQLHRAGRRRVRPPDPGRGAHHGASHSGHRRFDRVLADAGVRGRAGAHRGAGSPPGTGGNPHRRAGQHRARNRDRGHRQGRTVQWHQPQGLEPGIPGAAQASGRAAG